MQRSGRRWLRTHREHQSHTNLAAEGAPVQSSGRPSFATEAENSRRLVCFPIFAEPDAIVERVDDPHAFGVASWRHVSPDLSLRRELPDELHGPADPVA